MVELLESNRQPQEANVPIPIAGRDWTAATSYQVNCAVCHTSQLRNTLGAGLGPDNVVFREPGIGCEMCHGPSAAHVDMMTNGKVYTKGLSIRQ